MDITMPACGAIGLEKDTFCAELIFNYCSQTKCDLCPILNSSSRKATSEAALTHVHNIAELAYTNGFKKVSLHLIGGDSLEDWSRFVNFSEQIWEWNNKKFLPCPIEITATTCGLYLDEEKEDFLLKNSWRMRLIFRWNGENGRIAWNKFSVLKFHPMTYEVDYCLSRKELLKYFLKDMVELRRLNKRVAIEYLDLKEWKKADYLLYYKHKGLMKYVGLHRDGHLFAQIPPLSCGKKIITVSPIDKETYPCRYFSPERMTFSTLRDAKSEYDKDAICPVTNKMMQLGTYMNIDELWK